MFFVRCLKKWILGFGLIFHKGYFFVIASGLKIRVAIHFCGFSLSACLSSLRILGFAVLLVVLFVDFGAELD